MQPHGLTALLYTGLLCLTACGDSDGRDTDSDTDGGSGLTTTEDPTAGPGTDGTGSESSDSDPTGTNSDSETSQTTEDPTEDPTENPTETTQTTETTDDPTSESDSETEATTEDFCEQGTIVCEGNEAKICDGMGGFEGIETCPEECAPDLGCVTCLPGTGTCQGEESMICNDQGSGWEPYESCDPLQGLSCDEQTGFCSGSCSKAAIGASYIGCDYYPTVTQQLDSYVNGSQYAVAVANTSNQMATVTITRGDNPVNTVMVNPGSVQVVPLPWVNDLVMGTGPSKVVADGAYRLRSNQPVTVYQYNPLAANVTNDASLMLPVNVWSGEYVVAAWPFWASYPGFYSVTAKEDNTTVTLTPPASGGANPQPGGGVAADGTGVVTLNAGDVLQVVTANGNDLTGTHIDADKPVQVLGGHDCTQVPIGITACDHLEESMFPVDTLATEYIVVPPVQVPNDQLEKAQVVRVIATKDETQVTFSPDQGADTTLMNAGDFVELVTTTAKFKVTADKKILVAQYMVGQSAGFGTSDPAMIVAVATEQYRTNYLFHAPVGWSANYVDIIAPDGAAVDVDGQPVMGFVPIDGTGFSLAHVNLSNAGDGNHEVTSAQKVGISVYGVLNYGSYWYPGGLDLALIPE